MHWKPCESPWSKTVWMWKPCESHEQSPSEACENEEEACKKNHGNNHVKTLVNPKPKTQKKTLKPWPLGFWALENPSASRDRGYRIWRLRQKRFQEPRWKGETKGFSPGDFGGSKFVSFFWGNVCFFFCILLFFWVVLTSTLWQPFGDGNNSNVSSRLKILLYFQIWRNILLCFQTVQNIGSVACNLVVFSNIALWVASNWRA